MTAVALPRPYRRVLAASTFSNLSDGIRLAAFPLLAHQLTQSPLLIGLVAVASQLPGLLFALSAGWLSDQVERVTLARRVNSARCVLLVLLAGLVMSGNVTILILGVAAFVLGTSEVLADNTFGTIVPSLVTDDQLEVANSRMVASEIMGNEFVGPAIGGALFAVGFSVPFFSNAALLAVSVLFLAGLPLLGTPNDEVREGADDPVNDDGRIRDGIGFLVQSRPLRSITTASAVLIAIDSAWFGLLIVLASSTLDLPDAAFGLLLATGALGGFVGTMICDRFSAYSLSTIGPLVFGSMALPLVGLAVFPNVALAVVALIVTSGAFAVWNIMASSARQRLTPEHLLGRVSGAHRTVLYTAAVLGTLLGALIAEVAGIRMSLAFAGTAAAVSIPYISRVLPGSAAPA